MAGDVGLALQLTVVGMGMVFFALLVLGFSMVLLVRLGRNRAVVREALPKAACLDAEAPTAQPAVLPAAVAGAPGTEGELRQTAVALAVAIALALDGRCQELPRPFPVPPTALVSTWQAVMRANQMGRRRASR